MDGRPPSVIELADATGLVQRAKLRLLEMHYQSKVGHIGGNLSALDTLISLYHFCLGPNDKFVLSKGHSAGALYVTLWTMGLLSDEDLRRFHGEGTRLSGHPPLSGIAEVVFATGSLGHGLSLAAGLALGKKLLKESGRVFCLLSDGEWNEGSCWEALIFLAHQKLDNLTFIVDLNGMQGFGSTKQVANLDSLADKFRAFGVTTTGSRRSRRQQHLFCAGIEAGAVGHRGQYEKRLRRIFHGKSDGLALPSDERRTVSASGA